jgi:hypothetical protein
MFSGPAVEMCAYNQEIPAGAAEATSLNLRSQTWGANFASRFHTTLQPGQETLTEETKYRESFLSILILGNLKTNISLPVLSTRT